MSEGTKGQSVSNIHFGSKDIEQIPNYTARLMRYSLLYLVGGLLLMWALIMLTLMYVAPRMNDGGDKPVIIPSAVPPEQLAQVSQRLDRLEKNMPQQIDEQKLRAEISDEITERISLIGEQVSDNAAKLEKSYKDIEKMATNVRNDSDKGDTTILKNLAQMRKIVDQNKLNIKRIVEEIEKMKESMSKQDKKIKSLRADLEKEVKARKVGLLPPPDDAISR